jgi:hypothetical protein
LPVLWEQSHHNSAFLKDHQAFLSQNQEVLVLQRPLHHYDANTAKMVLQLLKVV